MKKLPVFVLFLVGLAACGDACESSPDSAPAVPAAADTAQDPPSKTMMRPKVHLPPPPVEQEGGVPAPSAVP